MLSLIYTNIAAATLFLVACLTWIVPEMIGAFRQRAGIARKGAAVQDRGSLGILIGLQWSGIALCLLFSRLLPGAAITWQRKALFGSGLALIPLGEALRCYAMRTLGAYFTRDVAVSEDQRVVRGGPYRYIRHPAYSGTFITMLGLGLALTNWAGLAVLLAGTFAGHMYRVCIEEKALVQTIGRPYTDYMRHTKRFIPLIF